MRSAAAPRSDTRARSIPSRPACSCCSSGAPPALRPTSSDSTSATWRRSGSAARSDTGDRDGVIEAGDGPLPGRGRSQAACAAFVGEIEQVPPTTSAIRIDGRHAYDLHRAGARGDDAGAPCDRALPRRRVPRRGCRARGARRAVHEGHLHPRPRTRHRRGARLRRLLRRAAATQDRTPRRGRRRFARGRRGRPAGRRPGTARPRTRVAHLPAREIDAAERDELAHGRAIALTREQGPTRCICGGVLVCLAEPRDGLLRPRVVLEPAA